jgi:hypothetical protein
MNVFILSVLLSVSLIAILAIVFSSIAVHRSNQSSNHDRPCDNYQDMLNYYQSEPYCTTNDSYQYDACQPTDPYCSTDAYPQVYIDPNAYCNFPDTIVGYHLGQDTPLGRGEILPPANSNTVFVKASPLCDTQPPCGNMFKVLVVPADGLFSVCPRLHSIKMEGWGAVGVEIGSIFNGDMVTLVNFLKDVKNAGLKTSLSVPNTGPPSMTQDWNYFYQTYWQYIDVFIPRMIFNNMSSGYNPDDTHNYLMTINSEENLKVVPAIPTGVDIVEASEQFLNMKGYVLWYSLQP